MWVLPRAILLAYLAASPAAQAETVIGAAAVSLLLGDGNPDEETFEVTYRDVDGVVLQGPNEFTTTTPGVFLFETEATLGAPIGSVEIRLVPSSASGVTFDDLDFLLSGTTAGTCANLGRL